MFNSKFPPKWRPDRLTNLVDVVRDVEHGLVGLLDEVVLLVRRRRVRHQLAQDQVILKDALNREDINLFFFMDYFMWGNLVLYLPAWEQ